METKFRLEKGYTVKELNEFMIKLNRRGLHAVRTPDNGWEACKEQGNTEQETRDMEQGNTGTGSTQQSTGGEGVESCETPDVRDEKENETGDKLDGESMYTTSNEEGQEKKNLWKRIRKTVDKVISGLVISD
jgi:hypothetical protein